MSAAHLQDESNFTFYSYLVIEFLRLTSYIHSRPTRTTPSFTSPPYPSSTHLLSPRSHFSHPAVLGIRKFPQSLRIKFPLPTFFFVDTTLLSSTLALFPRDGWAPRPGSYGQAREAGSAQLCIDDRVWCGDGWVGWVVRRLSRYATCAGEDACQRIPYYVLPVCLCICSITSIIDKKQEI